MSRPECRTSPALALAIGILATGCGKSNLVTSSGQGAASRPEALRPPPAPQPETAGVSTLTPVVIPLKLTPARAGAFARAVNLVPLDIPGSHTAPRSPSLQSRREEADGECDRTAILPVGGGRSSKLERGSELETESVSSSVIVMSSPQAARADLAYADSHAGLACYTRLLRRKLGEESTSEVHIDRIRVAPLRIGSGGGLKASGIRIEAAISSSRSGLAVGLFVDALGFDYGPAEIQLYATSFVQPMAPKTEDELLALMQARARLSRL